MNYDWEKITKQDEDNIFNFFYLFVNVIPAYKIDASPAILAKNQKEDSTIVAKLQERIKNARHE